VAGRQAFARVHTLRGVAGLNGGAFGNYGEGFIRFSYANSLQNLMEAVVRIEKASMRWTL
jgi:aspartate aminotransferase